jgi:hypothetical protein
MRRSARTAVFATALVATSATSATIARAEDSSITLTYETAKSATTCPDENTFRGLVAARLGRDPFVSAGVRKLVVEFERLGNQVVGRLDLSGDSDAKAVKRSLRTNAEECFELATSMALVVAVAIDPSALTGSTPAGTTPKPAEPSAPPPKTPEPEARATATPAPETPRPPEPPESSGGKLRFELGGLVAVGVVPATAAGARAGAGLDFGTWSVHVGGTFVSARSRDNPGGTGRVSAFALAGSVAPCVDPVDADSVGLELCAVGAVGALRSTARGVTRAAPTSTLLASLGPRIATIVMFSEILGVGVAAEAPIALSRARLYIEDGGVRNEVWAQPPVGFVLGASLVASIP